MNMTNAWRTIVLDCHESLSLCDNQMVVKHEEEKTTVPIEQIREILITSDKGSISLPLLVKLSSQNTKVVFCDAKRTPVSELTGLNLHFESAGKLMDQVTWTERRKNAVCKQIIKMKIARQRDLLDMLGKNTSLLTQYLSEVQPGDANNREALAAKYYFKRLFGNSFIRFESDAINAALNYGYTILCSSFNRAITLYGYNTALGICHYSRNNPFNLSCDLMEPFRPFVDQIVYNLNGQELTWENKQRLIAVLHDRCIYDGYETTISNAIESFVRDAISVMETPRKKLKEVNFIESTQSS